MARPIEDTPILEGADAERFFTQALRNETVCATQAEYDAVKSAPENLRRLVESLASR